MRTNYQKIIAIAKLKVKQSAMDLLNVRNSSFFKNDFMEDGTIVLCLFGMF